MPFITVVSALIVVGSLAMARELFHPHAGVHQIDPEWRRGRRYGFYGC